MRPTGPHSCPSTDGRADPQPSAGTEECGYRMLCNDGMEEVGDESCDPLFPGEICLDWGLTLSFNATGAMGCLAG